MIACCVCFCWPCMGFFARYCHGLPLLHLLHQWVRAHHGRDSFLAPTEFHQNLVSWHNDTQCWSGWKAQHGEWCVVCGTSEEEAVKSPMATVEHLLSLVGNMTALNTLEDEARYGRSFEPPRRFRLFHMLFHMFFHISGIGKDTKTIKNQGGSKTIGLSYLGVLEDYSSRCHVKHSFQMSNMASRHLRHLRISPDISGS